MIERTDIRDGGVLVYNAEFLTTDEAGALLDCLRTNVHWGRETGRGRPFPRLTAFVADSRLEYRYSGVTHRGNGWPTELAIVKRRIEDAAEAEFNSLLLNLYRDGRDSIGFHADDEPELGKNPIVASVSLGAIRKFVLKRAKSKESLSFQLAHGSLLVMSGTCQHHWLHSVPKTDAEVGERINLTFRRLI